ncbi:ArsR/SmtB family transcription factor [Peribacillus acanthi]|uniref:ArsR/SmtB family transcription factor n=1 Tax=Peribacillus acanthi TaxID=2171554 RepID=UPI0023E7CBED|nr:metalloregulator ArsR/SmtB family transcription factor [Peribacillus acanthi]
MENHDICEITCIHEEKVKDVRSKLMKEDIIEITTLFKALSDETRIKIAFALTIQEELCVCDVANIIGSTTATASHHLRLLRNLGLASIRKEGKLVYYSIKNSHFKNMIELAFKYRNGVKNHE